jgi:protein-disulfide isomerase
MADDRRQLSTPVGPEDHVQGSSTAEVTLLEYGDFECPYCRAAVPIVEDLQRRLGDHLRFVFRHFPLTNLHPNAELAAEAAEAAGAQGKFFEMHALLFEHQDALDPDDLLRYASDLGLDVDRFRRELGDHTHAGRVRDDFAGGLHSGARGTPTFYLDGLRYDGLVGVRQLLAAIRETHPDVATDAIEAETAQRPIPRVVRQRSPVQSSRR